MENINKFNECQAEEIKKLLFGRKVQVVNSNTLQLDNGLVLVIVPNEGCGGCSSGNYYLQELNGCDNAITNVELVEEGVDERSYKIFVFTEDKRIKLLQVDGDDGNGYYGTGYEIYVQLK